MRNIFKAIATALKAAFSHSYSAGRWVLKTTTRGIEKVWEILPKFSLGGGGGGSHEPDERDVAAQAAQQAQAQQRQADELAQLDAMAQCVLRVARALRNGQAPQPEDAAALAPVHVEYLLGLSRTELEIIASASMEGMRSRRAFVDRLVAPEGCRSFGDVARALGNTPVRENEQKFRTLADKLRARKLGTTDPGEQNAAVGVLVRKYSQPA